MEEGLDRLSYGVPFAVWLTLPLIIGALYIVFRWRKFGEDAFTWNHEYFKRAIIIGIALCLAAFVAGVLLKPGPLALFWFVAFVLIVLALDYWGEQSLPRGALLASFIVGIGSASVPVSQHLNRALHSPAKPAQRHVPAGVPRSAFSLHLPAGWKEVPGEGARTYRRGDKGSGSLTISLLPPPEPPPQTTQAVQQELTQLLASLSKELDPGQLVDTGYEHAVAGPMAYADYRSDKHGLNRYWMIASKMLVFATYTDGSDAVAEREIAEAHEALKTASYR